MSSRHFTLLKALHLYSDIHLLLSAYLPTHTDFYFLVTVRENSQNKPPHIHLQAPKAPLTHLKEHTHKHFPLLAANYVTMLIPRQRIKIALRLWMPVLMLRIVVAHTQVSIHVCNGACGAVELNCGGALLLMGVSVVSSLIPHKSLCS